MLFERYSFVALTTTNLVRARTFWSEQLGFPMSEERTWSLSTLDDFAFVLSWITGIFTD